jgi:nicotinamidase-related amidase
LERTAALLVVDVQIGLVDGFEDDWHDVLPVIGGLVARARAGGSPVVLIQHCGTAAAHPLHPDRAGWTLHPVASARPGDLLVTKRSSDAFNGTDLHGLLQRAGVTRVVIVGAQTEYCVDTTARRALSLGYDVDLVADGHTTSENGLLGRAQIIEHHNRTLAALATDGVTLRVRPAAEVEFH